MQASLTCDAKRYVIRDKFIDRMAGCICNFPCYRGDYGKSGKYLVCWRRNRSVFHSLDSRSDIRAVPCIHHILLYFYPFGPAGGKEKIFHKADSD